VPGVVINPLTDDMNTMRPRASRIFGRTACVTPIWAVTLTSSWRDRSSRDSPSTGPFTMMPGTVDDAVQRGGNLAAELGDRGPVGDVEGNRMHVRQLIEAAQGAVGSSGGVDVPPSPAHVFGDRQTDASAGAGNQNGGHVVSSLVVMGDGLVVKRRSRRTARSIPVGVLPDGRRYTALRAM
jgi:hypothetical protein